ncbi:MAG: hypothetical protein JRI25_11355 [Deltaproteobacteria bacterium]|nr:hypothetical protein [Deltaproteobacteria bacterium]
MSRNVQIAALTSFGASLLCGGLFLDSWWTIAGGVVALAGAAWLVTEPG